MNKNKELAEKLNKLFGFVMAGGDFSYISENPEMAELKDFLNENHAQLNASVLGFLVSVIQQNPNADIKFVPTERGVLVEYSYMVQGSTEFDEKGAIISEKTVSQNERE